MDPVVLGVLALVVCWQGFVILGLARKVSDLQQSSSGDIDGGRALSYVRGDVAPGRLIGTDIDGRRRDFSVRSGDQILLFTTLGCSACGRAVVAAHEVLTEASIDWAYVLPVVGHEEAAANPTSWFSQLPSALQGRGVFLDMKLWEEWGPKGTPTAVYMQEGIVIDLVAGAASAELMSAFVTRNGLIKRESVTRSA